jgi:hypothetical protein
MVGESEAEAAEDVVEGHDASENEDVHYDKTEYGLCPVKVAGQEDANSNEVG